MSIQQLIAKLQATPAGNGWAACCPCHDDQQASLSIGQGDNGSALLYCHAGCKTAAIVARLGLTMADLMPGANGKAIAPAAGKPARRRKLGLPVAIYPYRDAAGTPVYEVCRYAGKGFRQRKADGTWGMAGVTRVPYRLPELLAADPALPVYIVEGEKDAERLAALGAVATCNVGGAGKWHDAYSPHLRKRRVVVFADHDEAGREHAQAVAASVAPYARRVRVVSVPGREHGDISDWLGDDATLHDVAKLAARRGRLVKAKAKPADDDDGAPPIIVPVPLADLVRQHPELRPPVIDGLLRQGEIMNTIAASKVGKSWLAASLALCVANGRTWLGRFPCQQGRVLLIDNELHRETLAFRAAKVAAEMGLPLDGIDALPLRGRMASYAELGPLLEQIEGRYRLIVVDAHYRMLPNMSENDNAETMRVYNLLDHYAAQTGAAWNLVHHASKGDQGDKQVTDVGAGAGSQSRAADTHLILRRHEEEGCYAMEAAVRSFAPLSPLVLRWSPPLWTPADGVDANRLETPQTRKRKRDDGDAGLRMMDALAAGPASANQLAGELGMGRPRATRLLNTLVAGGQAAADVAILGGQTTTIYTLCGGKNER